MTSMRIEEMFGCRHPLQQAGMGGMATPALAIAVARAGAIGMVSGTVGASALAAQLDEVDDVAPVGVNFLIPFLDRAAVAEAARRSPLVEFFWGPPDPELVGAVHAGGARAAWQVGSLDEARAAERAGCDLVVAQGVEAGGHVRGTLPLMTLLPRVRDTVGVPVVAAGGIGTADQVAATVAAGADAVRVGTRFLAAAESTAHPRYVEALIAADADDTVLTTAFGVGWPDAPHRVLRSCIEAGERRGPDQVWTPNWPDARDHGPVESRALYAGRSVTAVRARASAAEIVDELTRGVPVRAVPIAK